MADIRLEARAPGAALDYFRAKGYAPPDQRFHYLDVSPAEHARLFVVAKADSDDILRTIRAEYAEARAEGQTFEVFAARLRPQLEALGWWGKALRKDPLTGEMQAVQLGSLRRLRVIWDANMRSSAAAGQWERIQRLKTARPWLLYIQVDRPSKRPEHARYNGLLRRVDDPVWRRIFPPNGWFCRCHVRQLTDDDLKRMGLTPTPDGVLETRDWVNPRTGEVESLPLGVDPGWDGNPGAAWLDIQDLHTAAAADLPEALRATERGLAAEIRARGLRDGEESLALYDMETGAPVDWTRGEAREVRPTALMAEAMRDPARRAVAVHNHPSSRALSSADWAVLLESPGLAAVVAVGHDGSVYRGLRRAAGSARAVALVELVSEKTWDHLAAHLPEPEAEALWPQLSCLIIADLGLVDFRFALAPRLGQIWEARRDFLEAARRDIGAAYVGLVD